MKQPKRDLQALEDDHDASFSDLFPFAAEENSNPLSENFYSREEILQLLKQNEQSQESLEYTFSQHHIVLKQRPSQVIGSRIWCSAKLLCEWLVAQPPSLFQNNSFVDIGCGIGLCGILTAMLGARRVVLTDLPDVLPIALDNASINNVSERVSTLALQWGCPLDPTHEAALLADFGFDVLIGSDLIYFSELVRPLIDCLLRLFSLHQRLPSHAARPLKFYFCQAERCWVPLATYLDVAKQYFLFDEISPPEWGGEYHLWVVSERPDVPIPADPEALEALARTIEVPLIEHRAYAHPQQQLPHRDGEGER